LKKKIEPAWNGKRKGRRRNLKKKKGSFLLVRRNQHGIVGKKEGLEIEKASFCST